MKIDVNNEHLMHLIGHNTDLNNGCAIIRAVIWRLILGLGGVLAALALVAVITATVIGIVLYVASPWFNTFDVDLSLSWLGPAWWADFVRGCTVAGLVTLFIVSAIASLFLLVGCIAASVSSIGKMATGEYNNKPAQVVAVVWSAVFNAAHKICPKVEIDLPPPAQDLINRRDKVLIDLPCCGTFNAKIYKYKIHGNYAHFFIESGDGYRDHFKYWFQEQAFSEQVVITDRTAAVDAEPLPK